MTGDTFEASVTDMMQTLYRVTCSQLSVEADREDAVQEALRRAWEKKGNTTPREAETRCPRALF